MKQGKIGIIAALAFCLVAIKAQADVCDNMIIDSAGVLDTDGMAQVLAATNKLVTAGAVVRVRIMKTPGSSGTLDRYEADQERMCRSWQDVSGVRRNTLVSFLYQTTGGATGRGSVRIFFGEYWKPELDPLWMPILQNKVLPFLRSGQPAHGVASGLESLAAAATAKATAMPVQRPSYSQPAPMPVSSPLPPQSVTYVTQAPSPPTDLSGLWLFLKAVFVFAVLSLLGLALIMRKRRIEENRAAQQTVKSRRDECASIIVGLDFDSIDKLRESLLALVLPEALTTVEQKIVAAKSVYRRATEKNRRLDESNSSNPEMNGLSAVEYSAMAREYADVLRDLVLAQSNLKEADDEIKKVQALVDSIPGRLIALENGIKQVGVAAKVLEEQRYRTTDERNVLAAAAEKLTEARNLVSAKNPQRVIAVIDEGASLVQQAVAALDALPKKKATLQTALASQHVRLEGILESIDARRKELAAIVAAYADDNSKLVRGNVDEAQVRYDDSVVCLERGKTALDAQEWGKADNEIGQAKAWLDQAVSYLQSVASLKTNLDRAMADAPKDAENVQADLEKATAFITTHGASLVGKSQAMRQALEKAGLALQKAKAGLAESKCDILRVTKEIGKAGSEINKIFAEAKEEDDKRTRLLARIERLRRDAPSAISAAKEFIADHSSDVDGSARSKLREAQNLFAASNDESSLEEKVAKAEAALKQARQAIKSAESDVEEKAAARRRERERQERARREREEREEESRRSSMTFVSVNSSSSYYSPAPSVSVFDSGGGGGCDISSSCDSGGGGGCDV